MACWNHIFKLTVLLAVVFLRAGARPVRRGGAFLQELPLEVTLTAPSELKDPDVDSVVLVGFQAITVSAGEGRAVSSPV